MTSRKPNTVPDFVVYITFPSSSKEYAYLCNIPGISQGSEVIANGTRVIVNRTSNYDPRVTKYVSCVPDAAVIARRHRCTMINARLTDLQRQMDNDEKWKKLAARNPEAKKLLAELKKLRQVC